MLPDLFLCFHLRLLFVAQTELLFSAEGAPYGESNCFVLSFREYVSFVREVGDVIYA